MISVPSSHSYFFQCLKRYAGVIVISLYLHASYIVDFAMAQQGLYLFSGDNKLGPQNNMMFYISLIIAILCGLQGFSYLHSEKKLILYLGLPLKRTLLFWHSYICGILIMMIPCIVSRIICIFLARDSQGNALYFAAGGILMNVLGFLLIYNLVILIILLTGRIWAALAGTAIALVYGTYFIGTVIEKYCTAFLNNYYKINMVEELTAVLSPIRLYGNMAGVNDYSIYDNWNIEDKAEYLFIAAAAILISGLLALFLFNLRPAESTGKALAFKKSKGFIKILLQIPLSLIIGYYSMQLSVKDRSVLLLLGGIIIGSFLLGGILEILDKADIKAFIGNKYQTFTITVICILISGAFIFDIWNYDSFLPDSDEIEAVAVSINGLETDYLLNYDPAVDYAAEDRLNIMNLTGRNKINALNWLYKVMDTDKSQALTFVSVAYKYHNDQIKYRRYAIAGQKQIEEFSAIYESEEYKQGTIPLAGEEKPSGHSFLWSNGVETYHLDFTDEENQELLDCYRADLAKLNIEQLIEYRTPIGLLKMTEWNEENGREGYIYPSFETTIGYLISKGFAAEKAVKDYEILKLEVQDRECNIEEAAEMLLVSESLAVNPVLAADTGEDVVIKCRDQNNRVYTVISCKILNPRH